MVWINAILTFIHNFVRKLFFSRTKCKYSSVTLHEAANANINDADWVFSILFCNQWVSHFVMTFTKLVISSVKWIAQLKHIYECEHAKNEWLSPLGPEAIATMRERNKNKFPCSGDESTQWSHLHISFHTFCTQRAHNNAWVSNENVIRKRYSRLFIVSLYFSCYCPRYSCVETLYFFSFNS